MPEHHPNGPIDEFDPRDALTSFRRITLGVLLTPRTFFAIMRTSGGFVNPCAYMAACVLANVLIVGFLSKNVTLMIQSLVLGLTFPFVTAGLLHFILTRLLGARGRYEAALRVNAYAAAVNLVSWFPLVGVLLEFYRIYVITLGLATVFETTARRAFLAVALTIALLMLAALTFTRLVGGG